MHKSQALAIVERDRAERAAAENRRLAQINTALTDEMVLKNAHIADLERLCASQAMEIAMLRGRGGLGSVRARAS